MLHKYIDQSQEKLFNLLNVKYLTLCQIQNNSEQFNSIQFNSIQFNSIQFNSIQFNSIQFNSIQFNSIQFNSIPFHSIPFHSIPFHSIQFNSIQFNSIQFNFNTTYLYKVNSKVLTCKRKNRLRKIGYESKSYISTQYI